MKRYSIILTGLLVLTMAVTGCAPKPEAQKMKDVDKKAFLDSCLSSCETTALGQAPTADKEFVKNYCKENCTCTANKVAMQLSMADITENLKKPGGKTETKLNDIIQQCSAEFSAKQTEKAKTPDAAAKPADAKAPAAAPAEKAAATPAKH